MRSSFLIVALAFAASACSGGGAAPTPVEDSQAQMVSGTISLGSVGTATAASRIHRAFVSASTTHAAVYIDGSTTASGSSTSCTATTGTGTACTIAWSAALSVPASHTFSVEIDNGTNILGEGSGSYAIVAGTNALSALSLNGVANEATFTVTGCSASTCNGNVTIGDASKNAIAYTGTTLVPTGGKTPTTGTVYDNGPITLASTNSAYGTISGTAQTSGSNVFSTYASGTLALGGVNTSGTYTYAVTCAAGATGSFGIAIGNGSSLVGFTHAGLTYTATVATVPTAPAFTCTAGVIGSTTGTLPIN